MHTWCSGDSSPLVKRSKDSWMSMLTHFIAHINRLFLSGMAVKGIAFGFVVDTWCIWYMSPQGTATGLGASKSLISRKSVFADSEHDVERVSINSLPNLFISPNPDQTVFGPSCEIMPIRTRLSPHNETLMSIQCAIPSTGLYIPYVYSGVIWTRDDPSTTRLREDGNRMKRPL